MTKEAASKAFVQLQETQAVIFEPPTPRPNIMLILMDDIGLDMLAQYSTFHISHLGFNPAHPTSGWAPGTPGFALFKTNGVRFCNAFANPTCSPTRAMLMSGRYAARQGIGMVIRESQTGACSEYSDPQFSTEPTLAEFLRESGYRTLMCGKYHLGRATAEMDPSGSIGTGYGTIGWDGPTDVCGFGTFRGNFRNLNQVPQPDTSGGILPGYYNYYWYESDRPEWQPTQLASVNAHVTRQQRTRLQNWINYGRADGSENATEPWFVYWAASVGHTPQGNIDGWPNGVNSGCAPPNVVGSPPNLNYWIYTAGYEDRWPSEAVWMAIENLSYELEVLKARIGDDVWNRTVFILMGDNGSDGSILEMFVNGSSYGGFTLPGHSEYLTTTAGTGYEALIAEGGRFKTSLYQGGCRVPLIVSGPDWIVRNPNRESYALVDAVDVHATIRRIARANYYDAISDTRGIDGVHFYDVLAGVTGADTAHRSWGLSERFDPPGLIDDADEYSYAYRELRSDGIWHLVQKFGEPAELYHTMGNEAGGFAAVDVLELNDLAGSSATVLADMQANYAALIAPMKTDQWPTE